MNRKLKEEEIKQLVPKVATMIKIKGLQDVGQSRELDLEDVFTNRQFSDFLRSKGMNTIFRMVLEKDEDDYVSLQAGNSGKVIMVYKNDELYHMSNEFIIKK